MKFILAITLLCTMFLISCNDTNNILKPDNTLVEGSFEKVILYCDSVWVVINYDGSSSNSYTGSQSWNYDKDGVWSYSGKFINTDTLVSEIKNDTLTFYYYYKDPGCYECTHSAKVFVKFNNKFKIIDSIYLGESNYYQTLPQHMSRVSYSSSSSSLKLENVPYSINQAGNVVIELTGANFANYEPGVGSHSYSYSSDYGPTGSSSSSNSISVKSIRDVPIASKFIIEMIETK